jgi:hypothetical protein
MSAWFDENVATLKRMWSAGKPVFDIATTLQMSKSKVIGKAHRLKLGPHPNQSFRSANPKPPKEKKPRRPPVKRNTGVRKPPRIYVVPDHPEPSLNVSFFDLEPHHCRYITGDETGIAAKYCGHQKVTEESWCGFHCSVVYQAPAPKSPAQAARPNYRTYKVAA